MKPQLQLGIYQKATATLNTKHLLWLVTVPIYQVMNCTEETRSI